MDLGLQGYDKARGREFYRQLTDRVESLPGVRSAAITNFVPLSLNYSARGIYVEGQTPARGANVPNSMYSQIGVGYFKTIGLPLVAGRDFAEQDKENTELVTIINETFARRILGADSPADAVGRRISNDPSGPWMKIIGIAKDGKYFTIGEAYQPFIYYPMEQSYGSSGTLIVRTNSDPKAMIAAVRNEVQRLDPKLPVYDVKTLEEHMSLSLFPARVAAAVLGGFGLVALILAAIGIYGVTSYSVAQRTRELGIRMALGAKRRDVVVMIVRQGAILAGIGLGTGLLVAFALTRWMASILYGVSATDAVVFVGVSMLLGVVTLIAGYLPARSAAQVDPMIALRYQ